jgi:hypothetical protein
MRTAAAISTTNLTPVAKPPLRGVFALAIGLLGLVSTLAWVSLLGYELVLTIVSAF